MPAGQATLRRLIAASTGCSSSISASSRLAGDALTERCRTSDGAKVRRRSLGCGENPRGATDAVLHGREIDVRVDEGCEPTAVQGYERFDAHFDGTEPAPCEVVSHVVSELEDEVGLTRHLALLNVCEITRRAHMPGAPRSFAFDDVRDAAIFLADHDAPRETHSLLVPAHVAAVGEKSKRNENHDRCVNERSKESGRAQTRRTEGVRCGPLL